jgi:hypothetical protein
MSRLIAKLNDATVELDDDTLTNAAVEVFEGWVHVSRDGQDSWIPRQRVREIYR